MTRYQRIEWKELETLTEVTLITLKGKFYAVRYHSPFFVDYTFNAAFHNFTNTYFITLRGGRGSSPMAIAEMDKIVQYQLSIIVNGYYFPEQGIISANKIEVCADEGRLSLVKNFEGSMSLAEEGKLSLGKLWQTIVEKK